MRRALLALMLLGGCATVDVYTYAPRRLPAGVQPLTALEASLRGLRDVSWSDGAGRPDPGRRATLSPGEHGVVVTPRFPVGDIPLDLSYGEIASGVRMVTQLNGSWTVHIYDRHHARTVQLEFASLDAARLFLDAANEIVE